MPDHAKSEPPCGYHGKYLRIDVGTGEANVVTIGEQTLRQFLGGSGLGTYCLLNEQAATADPLSPEAALIFAFSPLVGSPLTTSAKFAVVSKSPLTERINDSLASSAFALAGKRTGFDAICICGQATELSVFVIDHGTVRLEPAGDMAGLSTFDTESALKARYGGEFAFAVIGPAGERQVRYATISHDGRHAGRGGSGAVLGAKRIKAIAVRGTRRVRWAQSEALVSYAKELSRTSFGPATAKYRELGTAANLLAFNRLQTLPTRNFQRGSFTGAQEIAPESIAAGRAKAQKSCAACTIGCEHIYRFAGNGQARIEYENLFAFGPLCEVSDAEVVLRASRRCDELGIDTISTGATIAFAMECTERGLIDEPWLRFGNGEAVLQAIELIGEQGSDFGVLLGHGTRRAAEEIGGGSAEFAPHVKGLEIPGYEPRALQTMAVGFAVGSRGADHNRSGAYEVDFSEEVDRRDVQPAEIYRAVQTEDRAAVMDSLILCKFLRGVFDDFFADAAEMLQLVTGWEVTPSEMQETAQRIVTAKKLFNIRAGWTRNEDTLPGRMLKQPLADDARSALSAQRLDELIAAYYRERKWNQDGTVPVEQLRRFGLSQEHILG